MNTHRPPMETTLNLYRTPPAATLLQESHPIASALPESANGIPEIPPDTPCIVDTLGIMLPALQHARAAPTACASRRVCASDPLYGSPLIGDV